LVVSTKGILLLYSSLQNKRGLPGLDMAVLSSKAVEHYS